MKINRRPADNTLATYEGVETAAANDIGISGNFLKQARPTIFGPNELLSQADEQLVLRRIKFVQKYLDWLRIRLEEGE